MSGQSMFQVDVVARAILALDEVIQFIEGIALDTTNPLQKQAEQLTMYIVTGEKP